MPSSSKLAQKRRSSTTTDNDAEQKKRKFANLTELPCFSADNLDSEDALDFYRRHQILHVRCSTKQNTNKTPLEILRSLHANKDISSIEATWCVENGGADDETTTKGKGKKAATQEKITPAKFFEETSKGGVGANLPKSCYVSCILQDSKKIVDSYLSQCPISTPPFVNSRHWSQFRHSLPCWIFVGRHLPEHVKDRRNMRGRPEHTDSVSHDGTWHYQLSGSKHWHVRPMSDAVEWAESAPNLTKNHLHIECKSGDILMINTRLWWHYTDLPPTYDAQDQVSMSVARDFYCPASALPNKKQHEQNDENLELSEEKSFTNVDGLYAQTNVKRGEVVVRESEMPDCALPRSDNPNCEIGELEDGEGCLAALRDIPAGEWLSVAPSDSESDMGSYEEEEEDDEEDEEN